jgi:hypothetical protein
MLVNILFLFELLHIREHLHVILQNRKYTNDNLQTKRWYFFLDCLTALVSYIYIGFSRGLHIKSSGSLSRVPLILFPLSLFHCIAHLFYVFTWNTGYYANRIREWTSSDKFISHHVTIDFYLTIVDIFTHGIMSYYLFDIMNSK